MMHLAGNAFNGMCISALLIAIVKDCPWPCMITDSEVDGDAISSSEQQEEEGEEEDEKSSSQSDSENESAHSAFSFGSSVGPE